MRTIRKDTFECEADSFGRLQVQPAIRQEQQGQVEMCEAEKRMQGHRGDVQRHVSIREKRTQSYARLTTRRDNLQSYRQST